MKEVEKNGEESTEKRRKGKKEKRKGDQEKERLQALYRYDILDTPPEEEFDHIVELTSEICDTPLALISFIDQNRQWHKAKFGVDEEELARTHSFSTHCIQNGKREVMKITDASKTPIVQANPIRTSFLISRGLNSKTADVQPNLRVFSEPHLRFYAGAPMVDSDGHSLGCVCVMDYKPLKIEKKEKFFLKTMAEQIVRTLEKRAKYEELRRSQLEIEESLSYAKRIQNALFRPIETEASQASEHFMLLKPMRDISGDFCWVREHEGYFYIAAIDCTGHGVPGGFMSMLGISFLNDILKKGEEQSPSEILDQLSERIVRELKGGDPLSGAKDGMDAALLKIPVSEQINSIERDDNDGKPQEGMEQDVEVQFAGAKNPLYVIRKGIGGSSGVVPETRTLLAQRMNSFKENPDVIEIKGDRKSVGYDEYAEEGFKTVSLQLQKGDMLYLFSDGFPDQFGGAKEKKFKYRGFRELLHSIHEKPLESQKELLDSNLEEWKRASRQEQTDDVLVVGIPL